MIHLVGVLLQKEKNIGDTLYVPYIIDTLTSTEIILVGEFQSAFQLHIPQTGVASSKQQTKIDGICTHLFVNSVWCANGDKR